MKKTLKTLQKEESKKRILNVSSRLFKKQGYKATGVDQLMAEAGLTAGAFYAHFRSKEDLFEQCLEHALNQTKELMTRDIQNLTGFEKTQAVLRRYCSVNHRDFPDNGCILPALASEIYRGTTNSNRVVANYIEKWAQIIASHLQNEMDESSKMQMALQLISRSVGAILLSRIVNETELSEKILNAVQEI